MRQLHWLSADFTKDFFYKLAGTWTVWGICVLPFHWPPTNSRSAIFAAFLFRFKSFCVQQTCSRPKTLVSARSFYPNEPAKVALLVVLLVSKKKECTVREGGCVWEDSRQPEWSSLFVEQHPDSKRLSRKLAVDLIRCLRCILSWLFYCDLFIKCNNHVIYLVFLSISSFPHSFFPQQSAQQHKTDGEED